MLWHVQPPDGFRKAPIDDRQSRQAQEEERVDGEGREPEARTRTLSTASTLRRTCLPGGRRISGSDRTLNRRWPSPSSG